MRSVLFTIPRSGGPRVGVTLASILEEAGAKCIAVKPHDGNASELVLTTNNKSAAAQALLGAGCSVRGYGS